jgi:hypothetical protein
MLWKVKVLTLLWLRCTIQFCLLVWISPSIIFQIQLKALLNSRFVFGISNEIHHFVSLHYFPIDIFSMTVFTIFGVISVLKMMWQNLEGTINHWLHVFLLL